MKHNTLGLSLERGKADQCLVPRKQSVNSNGSYNLHESCVLSTYCVLGTASGILSSLLSLAKNIPSSGPLHLSSLFLFSVDTKLCFCLWILYCIFHPDVSSPTYPHLTHTLHSRLYSDMTPPPSEKAVSSPDPDDSSS